MAQQVLENAALFGVQRQKINDNFTELFTVASNTTTLTDFQTVQNKTFTNTDGLTFNLTPSVTTGAVGKLLWNDTDGTLDLGLKGGNVTLQVGQEQVQRVVNKSGSTLQDGEVVYITGAIGNRLSVTRANASSEITSGTTLGVVTENILNNQEGFVTVHGLVRGLNTAAFVEGSSIYLSTTDGAISATKPIAPNHTVTIGFVVRSHVSQGSIFVNVMNGLELDELHDVYTNSKQNNQLLRWNSSNSRWENTSSINSVVIGDVTPVGATFSNLNTLSPSENQFSLTRTGNLGVYQTFTDSSSKGVLIGNSDGNFNVKTPSDSYSTKFAVSDNEVTVSKSLVINNELSLKGDESWQYFYSNSTTGNSPRVRLKALGSSSGAGYGGGFIISTKTPAGAWVDTANFSSFGSSLVSNFGITGNLSASGSFSINTDKFTVDTSGNQSVAGDVSILNNKAIILGSNLGGGASIKQDTTGNLFITPRATYSTSITSGSLNIADQLISSLPNGTSPFVVASSTKVINLNADKLDGADWAAPGAIGSTTPAAGSFTTLSASGNVTLGDAATDTLNVGNGGLIKDAAGNVGIGVTPQTWTLGKVIEIGYVGSAVWGAQGVSAITNNVVYNSGYKRTSLGTAGMYTIEGSIHRWSGDIYGEAGSALEFVSPKMMLDANGNFFVGSASSIGTNANYMCYSPGNEYLDLGHVNNTASGVPYETFRYNGSVIGSITQNGTTAVAYNTTSDHRLKENVRPANAARFNDIEFVDFEWVDGRHDCGVIAHQLQSVYPDLVLGEKDAVDEEGKPVYQQVNYIGLIARMGSRIQQLESRLAALEAKL